ncbi:hypothetical protein HPB50_022590 [Hyalomma asiaticum]|uniref:Uncharacterized protein n=1 Tax=Hyalomma asiaticum TaxID=266040 RepID=A0ACB7SBK8_HYAAI|nr:hypothetical protein HPB50_022590 [Hyalomma asiaticum]
MDAMVRLLSVSTSLKEIVAQPIVQTNVPSTARALAVNRSVTKLSLYVEACRSLEDLFGVLELNDNLKELSLYGDVHVNRSCTAAVASALEHNSCLRRLHIDSLIRHDSEGLGQLWMAQSKNCTYSKFLTCTATTFA